jgi:hypothetical protein
MLCLLSFHRHGPYTKFPTLLLFASLGQARRIIEAWRRDYNSQRPHTSLNGLTPIEFANRSRMNQNQNRNRLYLMSEGNKGARSLDVGLDKSADGSEKSGVVTLKVQLDNS